MAIAAQTLAGRTPSVIHRLTDGRTASRLNAAGDRDQRAGDGLGFVGGQEQHDGREVGGRNPAIEVRFRHVAPVRRRVDGRRQNRVDRHAFQLQLVGQGSRSAGAPPTCWRRRGPFPPPRGGRIARRH